MNETPASGRTVDLQMAIRLLPLVGVVVYVLLACFARGFYGLYDVALEEVGLDYAVVLERALPAVCS